VKRYRVVFSELAARQLDELYEFIAAQAHPDVAMGYIERIESFCRGLETFPERGTARPELRPGLRTLGFERRATVAFAVTDDRVVILQILYGGQDVAGRLGAAQEED
jgi:toxin ParE1/3/4